MSEFKKCTTIEETHDYVATLAASKRIAVIKSRGAFYIEDAPAFIRNGEELLYEGRADGFKNNSPNLLAN